MLTTRVDALEIAMDNLSGLKVTGSKDMGLYEPLFNELAKAVGNYEGFINQKLKSAFASWTR